MKVEHIQCTKFVLYQPPMHTKDSINPCNVHTRYAAVRLTTFVNRATAVHQNNVYWGVKLGEEC
jgi:hypothetical protein